MHNLSLSCKIIRLHTYIYEPVFILRGQTKPNCFLQSHRGFFLTAPHPALLHPAPLSRGPLTVISCKEFCHHPLSGSSSSVTSDPYTTYNSSINNPPGFAPFKLFGGPQMLFHSVKFRDIIRCNESGISSCCLPKPLDSLVSTELQSNFVRSVCLLTAGVSYIALRRA